MAEPLSVKAFGYFIVRAEIKPGVSKKTCSPGVSEQYKYKYQKKINTSVGVLINKLLRWAGGVVLVSGFWFLVFGFWFLVSGFWFLVSGYWFLVSGFRVRVFQCYRKICVNPYFQRDPRSNCLRVTVLQGFRPLLNPPRWGGLEG